MRTNSATRLILADDEAGHNSSKRTYNALRNLFYWKGMNKSVHKHCTNCQTCAKHNAKVQQMKKEHFSTPPQPMEFIAMDLIGEFQAKGTDTYFQLYAC